MFSLLIMPAVKSVSARRKRRLLWAGKIPKSCGGLDKSCFEKNNCGKIVSKKRSELAKKNYKKNGLFYWNKACKQCKYIQKGEFKRFPKKGTAEHARIKKLMHELKKADGF